MYLLALTHHLKSKQSPVRQFLHGSAPQLLLAGSRGNIGREVAQEYRFEELTGRPLSVPIPMEVVDKRSFASPVGTAFDYRVRMMLGGFDPDASTAIDGLRHFQQNTKGIRRGRHMAGVLAAALDRAKQEAAQQSDEALDRLSVVLAWCESFYRAGLHVVLDGSLGKLLRRSEDASSLLTAIDPIMLTDLASLREASRERIEQWRAQTDSGLRFEPNPAFAGSRMVGGADADWLIGNTLIDCKTTERVTNPWVRDSIFQLLGYTLLDFDDHLSIRKLAIWLPRREALQIWSLDELLGEPAATALPRLRASFQSTLVAWHEDMAEERRARAEMWRKWREAWEAEQAAQAEQDAIKAEERKARRREADRRRRAEKKAAARETTEG